MAAVLVTLEKSAKGGMQKFFKYVPAVVLCYLIAMFLCTLGVWDMAETKPITFQSLILLLGSAFLVSAIATNVGNKLYALTNFSDKATWTVLFVTVVALIAAVTLARQGRRLRRGLQPPALRRHRPAGLPREPARAR